MNSFLLLSMMLNALLTFTVSAITSESCFILFRLQPRTRALLRFIPLALMIVEPFINAFSWLNPLICNSCVQKLLFKIFLPDLSVYLSAHEISVVTYLASISPSVVVGAIWIVFWVITAFFVVRCIVQVLSQRRYLQTIKGSVCTKIINKNLACALKDVTVLVSDQIYIPMASGYIYMPANMPLSKEEYESVLAHELEHIRWNDPLSRLVLHVLAALFWWVPLERWNTKIIQDQELACDQGVLNYGFRAHALASSLVKFARLNRSNAFCTALVGKASGSMIRLKALLGTDIVEANFASAGLLLSKKWGMLVLGLEALVFFAMCK